MELIFGVCAASLVRTVCVRGVALSEMPGCQPVQCIGFSSAEWVAGAASRTAGDADNEQGEADIYADLEQALAGV